MKYSIIVPVYNEEGNVAKLHADIVEAMKTIIGGESFEIIFIDDGSTDDTVPILSELSPLVLIQFRKNFGQTAAMDAGIKQATGEFIITLDGDGQNPPSEIPKLIEKQQENDVDVVSGWRAKRKDTFSKRFVSRVANQLRKILVDDGIQDSGCSLKIYRRTCFDTIDLYGEMHRFIPAILKLKGFTIAEVQVAHREREFGASKYNWKRTIKGLLDMLSVWFWKKYAARPLHLFGSISFFLIFISFVTGIITIYKKIVLGLDLSDTVLTEITLFSFLIGAQFFVFGLIADMLAKNYYASSKDQPYLVKKISKKE